jgi:hypothetical protein
MTQKMSKGMEHKSINDQILEAREEVERAIDQKLALTKEEIMHSVDLILGEKMLTGREAIMDVLERAAIDTDFMAMLAENPEDALRGRGLTAEEKAAISSGDIRRIEKWVGKLTPAQSKWLLARLQQEKW